MCRTPIRNLTVLWATGMGSPDVYPGGHSRVYHPNYVPRSASGYPSGPQSLSVQAVAETSAWFLRLEGPLEVSAGQTARQALAQKYRGVLETQTGADLSGYTTTEMVDQLSYFFFPNFFPWAGFGSPLLYRFRPNGNDPASCTHGSDAHGAATGNRTVSLSAQGRRLGPEEAWADAVELGGGRAAVFDQDAANMFAHTGWAENTAQAQCHPRPVSRGSHPP